MADSLRDRRRHRPASAPPAAGPVLQVILPATGIIGFLVAVAWFLVSTFTFSHALGVALAGFSLVALGIGFSTNAALPGGRPRLPRFRRGRS